MQERLARREPINIDFLTDRLEEYLDRFVQSPPYHLVASSLGAQISVEYAARHPDNVGKLVLLCPSGFGPVERFPVMEGARSKNYQGLVESTFFDRRRASPRIVKYYEQKFACKPWRRALFETVRGTKSHSVRDKLTLFDRPTLVICGREDRIVDPQEVYEAVKDHSELPFRDGSSLWPRAAAGMFAVDQSPGRRVFGPRRAGDLIPIGRGRRSNEHAPSIPIAHTDANRISQTKTHGDLRCCFVPTAQSTTAAECTGVDSAIQFVAALCGTVVGPPVASQKMRRFCPEKTTLAHKLHCWPGIQSIRQIIRKK